MSDLQDALDKYDEWNQYDWVDDIVDAARRVANPEAEVLRLLVELLGITTEDT